MRSIQKRANYSLRVLTSLSAIFLLLFSNKTFAQTKGEKQEVTLSATVSFSDIEKYSREHPDDPSVKRIGSGKNGAKQEEEEEELPLIKIPKNAVIMQDPYGKMTSTVSGKPSTSVTALNSVAPFINFNGIDDVGSVIPPDVGGQVGPNHVVTTLNGTGVRISSRTGTVISTVTLNAFFSSVGTPSTFDPKIIYDPFNNRWTLVACGNANSGSSAILLGVSASSDPTGTWKLYALDVDASNIDWFDYPSIGFNKDWIVIHGNMFKVADNAFSTGKLFIYKKSDLYAAVASPAITVINSGAGLCPAITYDNSLSTIYLLQRFNGNSNGNGVIALYNITGAIGSEVLSAATLISTPNPWNFSAGVTNFAPQSGTSNKVACNDDRIQKTIYRNGSIWATHTVFLPAASPFRSAAQWWQLSTAGAIVQRGRIDDVTGANFFAFPAIDVNKNNDVLIGCAKFSATTFPSACYATRMASDPVNTFQSDFVYKAGEASYFKTFGGSSNRWGDYTSVCVDPNDDMNFWTAQQYAKTGNLWGTWWAGICTPPPTPETITGLSPAFAGSRNQVFSVAPVSGATGYTWNFPAGCTITSGINTNRVTVTLGSTSGNVTVTANNGSCSSAAQSFSLTVNPSPTLTGSATNNGPLCPGNTLNLSATASGGIPPYTFSWSGPNLTATAGQNQTINDVTALNNGVYSVVITDNNSPASVITKTTNVVVNSLPNSTITAAGPLTFCNGDSVILQGSIANNRTYKWRKGSTIISGQTASSFIAKSAGNYRVIVTNTLTGCSRTSAAMTITVNALPTIAVITGNVPVCKGNTILLRNATPGGTWSSLDANVATVSNTGLVTGKLVGTAKITYTSLPNSNGCTNKASVTVTVKGLPTLSSTISGIKTACVGNNSQLTNATPGGTWSSSNNTIASVNSTGLVTGVAIGTVTITYTTAPNSSGCRNKATSTFSVTAPCLSKPEYAKGGSQTNEEITSSLDVSIAPNPTGNVFNLQVKAPKQESINLRVLDVNGRTAFIAKGMPGQVFHFGEQLKAGNYLVEVRQGKEVKTVKAVKVK